MPHFYFVLTNPEVESLLKIEVKDLKLAYSRPGFMTFKSECPVRFNPKMARLSGLCLGKFKLSELKMDKAWVWKRDDSYILPDELKDLTEKTFYRIGEKVTLIMMVGPDEFWVGEYELLPTHFQTPGEVSSILEKDVPSRAYYKIAEAFEAFDLPFEEGDRVLELGSAPGGASLFLLDQGLKVLGVDPAEMDPEILKNKNFKHLKKPFETLGEDTFKDNVHWILSDVNLPPTVVIKEVGRLLSFLNPKGVILTLKLNQPKHLDLLDHTVDKFHQAGFMCVKLKYLPSHRQEIALVALLQDLETGPKR